MNPYGYINCPHCGAETNVDPALVKDEDPMVYCEECDKPLFGEVARLIPEAKEEKPESTIVEESQPLKDLIEDALGLIDEMKGELNGYPEGSNGHEIVTRLKELFPEK